MATLRDKLGSASDFELSEILCKIWKLQILLERHAEHGTIGTPVQKQCARLVSALDAMASAESSAQARTFSNMLDASLSLVNDIVRDCVSPQLASATASTQDVDDDASAKFRTPHQCTYRSSKTAPSPGGAKELVWSPANIVSDEGQSTRENSEKQSNRGTFLERRARYQAFAVNFILKILRSENASRIQARKPPISPAEIPVLIRKGGQLGISREALAERYSELCPLETPSSVMWYHRNRVRAKSDSVALGDDHPVSLNSLFELAINELQMEAMGIDPSKESQVTQVQSPSLSIHPTPAAAAADPSAVMPADAADTAAPDKMVDLCEAKLEVGPGAVDPPAAKAEAEAAAAAADPSAVMPADATVPPADTAAPDKMVDLCEAKPEVGSGAVDPPEAKAEADPSAAMPADAADTAAPDKMVDECEAKPEVGPGAVDLPAARAEAAAAAAAADPSAVMPADATVSPADTAAPDKMVDLCEAKPEACNVDPPAAKAEAEAAAAAADPSAVMQEKGAVSVVGSSRILHSLSNPRRSKNSAQQRDNSTKSKTSKQYDTSAKENKRAWPGNLICVDVADDHASDPLTRTNEGNSTTMTASSHSGSSSPQLKRIRLESFDHSHPVLDVPSPPTPSNGNGWDLNEMAAVNRPTSGLTQRAHDTSECRHGADRNTPDQSDAQCATGARGTAASITGSILERFTSPIEREQVGSILDTLQAMGFSFVPLNTGNLSSPGPADTGSVCQIQARIDSPRDCTVLPGVEVTVLVERQGRPVDTLYNSPLFRQAHAISAVNSCRRRKPFDRFLEQPIPFSSRGEYFGYSARGIDGKVVVFLVVERAAQNSEEWLSTSAANWKRDGQMDERIRGVLQLGVYALSQFRGARIVLGNVKGSTIGVNHDGTVVFQGSGNSLRYNEGEICQILQRRTTSYIVGNPGASRKADKAIKRLLRGQRAKASAVRKKLPRTVGNLKGKPKTKSLKGKPESNRNTGTQEQSTPLERQVTFLSPTKIAEIMQDVVAKSEGLASLGDGSACLKVEQSSSWSSEPLRFLEASRGDMYGLLRSGLMFFNPVDKANHSKWDQEAKAAEKSQLAMKKFLTKGISNKPLQPQVLDRAADFFYMGLKSLNPSRLQEHPFLTLPIHPPITYQQIFHGVGFRVNGGKVDEKVGAPPIFYGLEVKEVVVTGQNEMGAGLQSTAAYNRGDFITFYFGKARRGTEILDDPPGRYVLAIWAKHLYANGEFSETATLAKFAERKAMGVCINAANAREDKNCTFMRRDAKIDLEGNIWAPIVASWSIQPGEYFGLDYGPEAAYGRSFNQ